VGQITSDGTAVDEVTLPDWVEDQPTVVTPSREISNTPYAAITGWPRPDTGTLKAAVTAEQLACFDIVGVKPFQQDIVASAQAINPNLTYLREWCPQENQHFLGEYPDCTPDTSTSLANGLPFASTGAITAVPVGSVFAGHWLYKPYTTLTGTLSSGGSTVTVASTANLSIGSWVCIYTGASFADPEHCKITNISGLTVTLGTRGHKSTQQAHSSGDRMALHQQGNANCEYLWAYNLSDDCPLDDSGAGEKMNERLAEFMAYNYDKQADGTDMTATCHGVLLDSDFHEFVVGGSAVSRDCDCDNDQTADYGFFPNGTNSWGVGLETFYARVRHHLDQRGHTDAIVIGGDFKSHGLDDNCGSQMETFPDSNYSETLAYPSNYNNINSHISAQKMQMANGDITPRILSNQNKSGTDTYGGRTDDKPARLAMALGLMFDGTSSFQNSGASVEPDVFRWWDEMAVDLTPGTNYGKAVVKTDTAGLRAAKHWLGQPLGDYERVYTAADLEEADALWETKGSSYTGWTGTNTTGANDTVTVYEGTNSLKVTLGASFSRTYIANANIISPTPVSLTSGQPYAMCFAVYAPQPMSIRPRLGTLGAYTALRVPAGWSKHVVMFYAASTGNHDVWFECGMSYSPFYLDQIMIFNEELNLFRRKFENGIAIANASPSSAAIDLGGTYDRILGTQDATHNSGATGETSITLAAWDGMLLVVPEA
jgi:hypothetical protein